LRKKRESDALSIKKF